MFQRRLLIAAFFVFALALTSCGGGMDFDSHYSDTGLIPENFLPGDVGMLFSYSLRDSVQYTAVQAVEAKLGDAGRVSRTFADQFDEQFKDLGVDFARDVQPALGDQFRALYALRMTGSNTENTTPEAFGVLTLKDPAKLETLFDVLVDAKQVEMKTLDGATAYVNNDKSFYAVIHDDLLLMADNADNLMAMLKQDSDTSFWASDTYQDALLDVGSDQVLYAMIFPANYLGAPSLPGSFSLSDIPSIIDHQTLVVRAEEAGLRFQAFVIADEEKAKAVDVSFDAIPHSDPYLFKDVPSEHLLGYFESFGLKQSLDEATKLGAQIELLDTLRTQTRTYFGMDFDEDILSFLDKGYALAFHQNGTGILPGMSVYVDIASNPDGAKELVDKVDGQLSGLIASFGAALPGVFTKDTVTVNGATLSRIKVDLTSIPRTADSPFPTAITDSPIELIYGIVGERLLISTATAWEAAKPVSIADSTLYKDLGAELTGVTEGLILVDAQELAGYAATLRALREQLDLQNSEEATSIEDFLKGFEGFVAAGHSNAYDTLFGGTLKLAQ